MNEFENELEREKALESINAMLDNEEVVDDNQEEVDTEDIDEEVEEVEEETEDEENIEYEVEEDEEDSDEDYEEEETDSQEHISEEDTQVPLKALTKERKKYKQRIAELEKQANIAKMLMQSTGLNEDNILQEIQKNEIEMYKARGVDEQTAIELVERKRKEKELERQLREFKYDSQINELKRNDFYKDIDMVKDDVIDLAESKGLSLEQAYLLTVGPEKVLRQKKEAEKIQKIKQRNKKKVKIDTSSKPRNMVKKVKLTRAEQEVIKASGMDPKTYIKLKNSKESIF